MAQPSKSVALSFSVYRPHLSRAVAGASGRRDSERPATIPGCSTMRDDPAGAMCRVLIGN
eukprot:1860630-Prymnesium_polylepis.1